MNNLVKYLVILFLIIVTAISFFVFGYLASEANRNYQSNSQIKISDEKLWNIVNNWRESKGFPRYQVDAGTCNLASARVIEIQNEYSHKMFFNHLNDFRHTLLGENLSDGYSNETEILDNWLNSPTHAKNLYDPFTHSCIKCLNNRCVHIFASY